MKIVIFALTIGTTGVKATKVDASGETEPEISRTGCPPPAFVCDIILHTSTRINVKFLIVNRAAKPLIILPGISTISITTRIVYVLLRAIYTQPFAGNFELFSGIAKCHKG